jgi:hypothetical protein
MEKTAVEWLYEQFLEGRHHTDKEYEEIFNQAKEMEKQQEIETWSSAYDNGFNNCKKKYKTKQQEQ